MSADKTNELEQAQALLQSERQARGMAAAQAYQEFLKTWQEQYRVKLRLVVRAVEVADGVYANRAEYEILTQ